MSLMLMKTMVKKNWRLFSVFLGVLTMYLIIIIYMFDPQDMDQFISMLDLFPENMMQAMGFKSVFTDLTGYLASWLYGLLMLAFPMVYCIILSNRLVAKMIDNGSFANLLSTPNSRRKIILTQGVFALLSVAVLFFFVVGISLVFCAVSKPGLLDAGAFIRLNLTTMLVSMVVMMISFFFSCLFNESRQATGLGSAIPIAFLLINMIGGVSEKLEFLKMFSIFGFYDPVELVYGSGVWKINLVYIALVITLFAGSIMVFDKKRLPL